MELLYLLVIVEESVMCFTNMLGIYKESCSSREGIKSTIVMFTNDL